MSFYSPWGLLALLGIPVIVVLYLLKQRHTDYNISSLYLWRNAVQDIEASMPWQKLRNNILMFLQILAVIVLALILAEPYIRAGNRTRSVLLVLDTSLSMQSNDIRPTRFEAAKKDMAQLVECCDPGTEFSIISSGRKPAIVQHLVDDRSKVLQVIKNLKVTDCVDDMGAAAELAISIAGENPGMEVYWFGDEPDVFFDESINYYSYEGNGFNYAVTMLSYRKIENREKMTVLSRIENFSGEEVQLNVSLYANGSLLDARRVKIGTYESESLYWQEVPESATSIECRIDTEDSLKKDNSAVTMVYPDTVSKVLLATEKNLFLEKVLSLMPGLELYRTTEEDMDKLEGFDIYVFDGIMPLQLPDDGHVIMFNPPPCEYFQVLGETEYVPVKPYAHEFFESMQQDISFGAMKTDLYALPGWGNPLMRTEEGITAFEGFMGKNRLLVFGFDLHQTNLPVKPFFPILMTRVVEVLTPGNMYGLSSVYAGDPVELPVDPEAYEVYVTTPGGDRISIAPPFPPPAFDNTLEAGLYTLEQHTKGKIIKTVFSVNTQSEKEFKASADQVSIQGIKNAGSEISVPERRNLTNLLLWLLLAVLLTEWWFYTNGNTV